MAITYTTATGAITSISGTVGGATVTGPGTTNVVIASNGTTSTITPDNKFSSSSPYIDTSGIEFSAGGTTYVIQYTTEGSYEIYDSQNEFAGVRLVTVSMTCYTRGTHISTDRGDCPIEALQIGDLVLTASGALRPIRWIGHHAHDQRFAAHPNIAPILIRAGALDDGVPARDLYVSPQHAMLLDGVLVPAKCLINNTTIVQPKPTSTVAYFHIELESHDVILAEGAPSETYVNDDNRAMFENADEYQRQI